MLKGWQWKSPVLCENICATLGRRYPSTAYNRVLAESKVRATVPKKGLAR